MDNFNEDVQLLMISEQYSTRRSLTCLAGSLRCKRLTSIAYLVQVSPKACPRD